MITKIAVAFLYFIWAVVFLVAGLFFLAHFEEILLGYRLVVTATKDPQVRERWNKEFQIHNLPTIEQLLGNKSPVPRKKDLSKCQPEPWEKKELEQSSPVMKMTAAPPAAPKELVQKNPDCSKHYIASCKGVSYRLAIPAKYSDPLQAVPEEIKFERKAEPEGEWQLIPSRPIGKDHRQGRIFFRDLPEGSSVENRVIISIR